MRLSTCDICNAFSRCARNVLCVFRLAICAVRFLTCANRAVRFSICDMCCAFFDGRYLLCAVRHAICAARFSMGDKCSAFHYKIDFFKKEGCVRLAHTSTFTKQMEVFGCAQIDFHRKDGCVRLRTDRLFQKREMCPCIRAGSTSAHSVRQAATGLLGAPSVRQAAAGFLGSISPCAFFSLMFAGQPAS